MALAIEIVRSGWLYAIWADPISKVILKKSRNSYYTENGFSYSVKDKLPDFSIRLNQFKTEWQKGQDHYEQSMLRYLERGRSRTVICILMNKKEMPRCMKSFL